jgi:hypothetical protein
MKTNDYNDDAKVEKCKPKRPKKVILVYEDGQLEIPLDDTYYGGLITGLQFTLKYNQGGPPKCKPDNPGKWKKSLTSEGQDDGQLPPPGCCYVDGELVCW